MILEFVDLIFEFADLIFQLVFLKFSAICWIDVLNYFPVKVTRVLQLPTISFDVYIFPILLLIVTVTLAQYVSSWFRKGECFVKHAMSLVDHRVDLVHVLVEKNDSDSARTALPSVDFLCVFLVAFGFLLPPLGLRQICVGLFLVSWCTDPFSYWKTSAGVYFGG